MSLPTHQDPLEEAAAWLARQDAGLTPAEENELDAWLQADERHAAAWAEVQEPWEKLDQARADGMAEWMMMELDRRERRRAVKKRYVRMVSIAAAAVAAFGITVWSYHATRDVPAEVVPINPPAENTVANAVEPVAPAPLPAVVLLKPEQRVLEDGTVVDLKGDALLSVAFTPTRREVRLISGTAHFEVFHDASRPFIVHAGAVSVRAVGTAFAVERSDRAADVLVTEGRVGVERSAAAGTEPVLVSAGSRVVMSYDPKDGTPQVENLGLAEIASRLQWRVPRLQLRGASLVQVVELLNALGQTKITITDPTLEQLRFSGLFRADNATGFVQMLHNNYGVEVSYPTEHTITLSRR